MITEKDKECYWTIIEFVQEEGYLPSVRELCRKLDLSSSATVHSKIKKLRKAGYLRDNISRIALTDKVMEDN